MTQLTRTELLESLERGGDVEDFSGRYIAYRPQESGGDYLLAVVTGQTLAKGIFRLIVKAPREEVTRCFPADRCLGAPLCLRVRSVDAEVM